MLIDDLGPHFWGKPLKFPSICGSQQTFHQAPRKEELTKVRAPQWWGSHGGRKGKVCLMISLSVYLLLIQSGTNGTSIFIRKLLVECLSGDFHCKDKYVWPTHQKGVEIRNEKDW